MTSLNHFYQASYRRHVIPFPIFLLSPTLLCFPCHTKLYFYSLYRSVAFFSNDLYPPGYRLFIFFRTALLLCSLLIRLAVDAHKNAHAHSRTQLRPSFPFFFWLSPLFLSLSPPIPRLALIPPSPKSRLSLRLGFPPCSSARPKLIPILALTSSSNFNKAA